MKNIPYEDDLLYMQVAYLKSYPECLLADAKVIYSIIFKKLKNQLSSWPLERAASCYSELCQKPWPSSGKTRVYVVSSSCRFLLVLYDMDECVVNEMLLDHHVSEECISTPYTDMDISPDCWLSSTRFVFNENGLVSCDDLDVNTLSNLLVAFHRENLVNYQGVRYDMYAKPRRLAQNK